MISACQVGLLGFNLTRFICAIYVAYLFSSCINNLLALFVVYLDKLALLLDSASGLVGFHIQT